ncbi:PDZ domain-containing protein [Microbacterium sp. NPDC078428]|uniref:PDZ domain-containing protein n=1 Tax=Microbacterium sp. NPDC078428 TaxID=3364190 RepID=UPI0037CBD158
MALFDENVTVAPARRPPLRRGVRAGYTALAVALVILATLSFLPTGYVIQQPGPVYNTLGVTTGADGEEIPLIQVEGAETFETTGALHLTTVQVVGNRERTPSWLELVGAWFDSSRAVVPLDSVFPAGQSTQQRSEQNAALMVDSQQEATAAALSQLGFDIDSRVQVYSVPEGSPAEGILEPDDVLLAADGEPLVDVDELREAIQRAEGEPVSLTVDRGGERREVEVTPTYSDADQTWQIGVTIISDYDFPIDVTIQLDNVGGPSAGMMFALGIIDTLTPDDLTGGEAVAGTGTITADGDVGPIGGIRQKLHGARDAGADVFLAPIENCDEVVGHVPSGLRVFAVDTLDDSLAALDALREGGDHDALPSCETP